jgi:hypothetical protein
MVPASAPSPMKRQNSSGIGTCWPFGSTISATSLTTPASRRRAAASEVAVAQLPVV